MRRATLLWTLLPPLLLVLVLTLVLVTGFTGRAMRGFVLEKTESDLERVARLIEPQLAPLMAAGDEAAIQAVCRRVLADSGIRLTVVLAGGRVVGDSEQDPAIMENHAGRPEVMSALAGTPGSSLRYSPTLKHQRLYVAIPAGWRDGQDDQPFVIRASVSMRSLSLLLRRIYAEIALTGLALLAFAAAVSLLVTRGLARKLGYLRDGATGFAAGRLDQELKVADPVEMSQLAHAMNLMARQLDQRIRATESQRQELAAVLASMVEGVLAVDADENVIRLNATASRLLGRTEQESIGRSIQEVGHNSELTLLAQLTLEDHKSRSRDISLGGPRDTLIEVQASGLFGQGGQAIGALLVFNDVTRIRRLQTMRRDFVANVSHELKTPITSIKGFVETLIETPPEDPAEMHRFLGIINRQADRLSQIIGDLLALSRLERHDEIEGIEFFELPLRPILERVVRDFQNRAPDQAGRIRLECAADARARVNAPLLEQAVSNLIDNALKYGQPETPVVVECGLGPEAVTIAVTDQSAGIGAQHLPRLFERFYRVDKARSRQMGGTGLGLAIVKHIAQAHGGRATVTSATGVGSTFTITLPREVSA